MLKTIHYLILVLFLCSSFGCSATKRVVNAAPEAIGNTSGVIVEGMDTMSSAGVDDVGQDEPNPYGR